MSEPQVAQIGMAQTEIFRFGVLMTSQRKSLCYQTRGKLSCLPDSNLPRLSGVGYPPANRGPVRGDPCSSKHNSCKLYARSSRRAAARFVIPSRWTEAQSELCECNRGTDEGSAGRG
jgi:hypothetical protein